MGWVELVIHPTYKLTYLTLQIICHGGDFTCELTLLGYLKWFLGRDHEVKSHSLPPPHSFFSLDSLSFSLSLSLIPKFYDSLCQFFILFLVIYMYVRIYVYLTFNQT